MIRAQALTKLKTWLFCAALFSAQLVLAEHGYQHDSEPHPSSCELCLQNSAGGDNALVPALQLWFNSALETGLSICSASATPAQTRPTGHRPRAPPLS